MFDISCIESYGYYHKKMKDDPVCEEEIEIISKSKLEIVKKIMDLLFENCDGAKVITYQEFYKVFEEYYNEGVINLLYFSLPFFIFSFYHLNIPEELPLTF